MPIMSRFREGDVQQQYVMPSSLMQLFDKALPMGTIMEKREFKEKLSFYESYTVKVGELDLSCRPAWVDYYPQPKTHLMIVGHILFCHINSAKGWYYQPSTRLFSEDPKARLAQFKTLINRAQRQAGVAAPLAMRLVA